MASYHIVAAIVLLCAALCNAAAPVITGVTPALSTTGMPFTITIAGIDLPNDVTGVFISGIECTGASLQGANIECEVSPGLGAGNKLVVTYGTNQKVSFLVDFPAAVNVEFRAENPKRFVAADDDASEITIRGENFGEADDTTMLSDWTGRIAIVVQGVAEPAQITEHHDEYIVATLPHGVGADLKAFLQLGSQKVEIPDLRVSYPAPVATDAKELTVGNKRAANTLIAVYGRNFGTPNPFVIITVMIGHYQCVNIRHISDTEVHCTVVGGGAGTNYPVLITVNGQSNYNTLSVGSSSLRFDFAQTTTPTLACSTPYGSLDALNPDLCNCWSGSAPSNPLLNQDCSLHAVCPGRLTTQTVVAQSAPSRPETQFKDDKLWIKQTAPIVKNRRDTIIQFVVPLISGTAVPTTPAGTISSSTCNYPGTIWSKTVNSLDCLDEYYGVLPWSQSELCGFVEDTTTTLTYRVYKSNLVTSYTETFKNAQGQIKFRKISNAYLLTVTFARQIKALTSTPVTANIADEDATTSMDVVVDGDALYDVASKNTIIQFTTTMTWPYQIHTSPITGTWTKSADNTAAGTVTATAMLNPTQPGELECDQTQDTECEQAWILTIQTLVGAGPQVCNLKGTVAFNTDDLFCRDYTTTGACAGQPSTDFSIQIGKTDLCDDAPDVDASKGLSATLASFYDAAHEDARSTFQTGDMIYFVLTVVDPSSSIDTITFADVHVTGTSATDSLFVQSTPGAPLTSATMFTATQFDVTQELREPILMANTEGKLMFQFRLLRNQLTSISSLSTVTAADMTQQLTVEATVDIAYHGNANKKRSTISTTLPAVAHHALTFYDLEDVEDLGEPHANDAVAEPEDTFDMFGSPASTVVASFVAVVAAVALVLA